MDCKLVSSKLVQYFDEDLPKPIYCEISDHLDHCYLCCEEYHEIVRVTDLAREVLRCNTYRDRYDMLRTQLDQDTGHLNVTYFPRRMRILKSLLTGVAVAAAALLVLTSVGLPAIETLQAIDAAIQEQAIGGGQVANPEQARGHSLVAWSSQIRWAESLSAGHSETAPELPEQPGPSVQDPLSSAPPLVVVPPFCRSGVIVFT